MKELSFKDQLWAYGSIIGVLSCMMLMSLPAMASDSTLDIFGNANMDTNLNDDDIAYLHEIIDGTKEKTKLADANLDGKIDDKDITRIEEIIKGDESEIVIIDSANRTVKIKKPVKRVIPLNTNILETMRSIKAKDKVIAKETSYTGREEIIFAEFRDLPTVGSSDSPDVEKILELKPDLVLWYPSYPASKKEIMNALDSAGIKVLGFDCYKPASYSEEVKKLGYVFGKEGADEFLDFYEAYINSIKKKTESLPEEDRPTVYVETSAQAYNSFGSQSGYQEKIWIAGGKNLFGDLNKSSLSISPEDIITRNPDSILKTSTTQSGYNLSDSEGLKKAHDELLSRSELANTTAVKNDNVHVIEERITGGVRNFVGIGYFAKWLHPDLFKDLDPQAIHQEYLTRFQGLDYDLSKQGVFVYPEERRNE